MWQLGIGKNSRIKVLQNCSSFLSQFLQSEENLRVRENLFPENLTSDKRYCLFSRQLNLRRYFDLGPLATKRCQISPMSRKFEFPAFYSKQVGRDLGPFFGDGKKSKYFLRSSHLQSLPIVTYLQALYYILTSVGARCNSRCAVIGLKCRK